jgi:hypothetical protein
MAAAAGCAYSTDHKGAEAMSKDEFVTVTFSGVAAPPELKRNSTPVLRIPRAYIHPREEIGSERQLRRVSLNLLLPFERVPIERAVFPQWDAFELYLGDVGNNWPENAQLSIASAREYLPEGIDADSGLHYVELENTPGFATRRRYFIDANNAQQYFQKLECVYFEPAVKQENLCMLEVMPAANLRAVTKFRAEHLNKHTEIARAVIKLVQSWQ